MQIHSIHFRKYPSLTRKGWAGGGDKVFEKEGVPPLEVLFGGRGGVMG